MANGDGAWGNAAVAMFFVYRSISYGTRIPEEKQARAQVGLFETEDRSLGPSPAHRNYICHGA